MELVSIIYNSLLVVFSLLGIVLITSFFYSKISGSGNLRKSKSRGEFIHATQTEVVPVKRKKPIPSIQKERVLSSREKEQIAHGVALAKTQIEQKLIVNNKVRVVSQSERPRSEKMRSNFVNSVSRYSVVNTPVRESSTSNELYAKFSKMSVEYSQG